MLNWQKWQMFVESEMIVRNEAKLKKNNERFNYYQEYITHI